MMLLKGMKSLREMSFLRRALASGGTLVDAGAHIGTLCLPFAKMPGVRIVAVEPNPTALTRLRFNIAANGFANIRVVPAALGDEDGTIVFGSDAENIAESAIGRSEGEQIEVPLLRLETVLDREGVDEVTALKLDIQFYEDRTMLPFFRDVDRHRWPRHVLIESIRHLNDDPKTITRMKELGYREIFRTHQNVALSLA
jgi:FkbM family methyltransferase